MDAEQVSHNLEENLKRLGLPEPAVAWLGMVWELIQFIDDACDGDKIGRDRAEAAAMTIFVGMALNPFWRDNAQNLLPVLALQVQKWRAANAAEAAGRADARSYMWRAGYYDLCLLVCQLCGCAADPERILGLYGESFYDYAAEFGGQVDA